MMNGKKVCIVMPAYNALRTLERTYKEIPLDIVDDVILVDDASRDATQNLSKELGIATYVHVKNLGYGGNQKTCYSVALSRGADIVVMLHPDYQYTPRLVAAMVSMLAYGVYDVVLGSRVLGGTALKGGMPFYKYVSNRILTATQNLITGAKLSEYHTGYRAFSRRVLETLPLEENDDDFVFDNQMLMQALYFDFNLGEISCPTKYFPEASSINFRRSLKYGLSCLICAVQFYLARKGIAKPRYLNGTGQTLDTQLSLRPIRLD